MRAFLGALAGIVAGVAALLAIGFVGGTLFPIPVDPHIQGTVEQAVAALPNAPLASLLFITLSWFLGGLVSALVAKLIARRPAAAWSAAGVITLLTFANVFLAPFPAWMAIASVAAPLIGGLIGNHLVGGAAPEAVTVEAGDEPAEV
jgi:membrane protein YqaA with SNARE-associated domain